MYVCMYLCWTAEKITLLRSNTREDEEEQEEELPWSTINPFACIQKPNLSESQKHRQQIFFFCELQSQMHFRKEKNLLQFHKDFLKGWKHKNQYGFAWKFDMWRFVFTQTLYTSLNSHAATLISTHDNQKPKAKNKTNKQKK